MDDSVTRLLEAWSQGDEAARDRLIPLVYGDLKKIAQQQLRGDPQTLAPTALVHETYLKLAQGHPQLKDRLHFYSLAARMARQILVDHARAKSAQKREGLALRVELPEDVAAPASAREFDVAGLDQALRSLAEIDPRQAQLVELRFFGGLSIEEAAESLNISTATAKRDWSVARAWLRRALS